MICIEYTAGQLYITTISEAYRNVWPCIWSHFVGSPPLLLGRLEAADQLFEALDLAPGFPELFLDFFEVFLEARSRSS